MQQATCAHSGAGASASSVNRDDLSRRAIFAGMAGAAALLAITPASIQAGFGHDDWARQVAHHDALKRRADDLWNQYKLMPPSVREKAIGEQVERASEAVSASWGELMKTPAPHLPALRWKLEQLLEIEDDGMSASWSERLVRPVLADIARLMGGAA